MDPDDGDEGIDIHDVQMEEIRKGDRGAEEIRTKSQD